MSEKIYRQVVFHMADDGGDLKFVPEEDLVAALFRSAELARERDALQKVVDVARYVRDQLAKAPTSIRRTDIQGDFMALSDTLRAYGELDGALKQLDAQL
jgi:hypothetical protein